MRPNAAIVRVDRLASFSWGPVLAAFIVELAWKAGLIIGLAAAASLMARAHAAVRHTTWTAASVALLVLPLSMMFVPRRLTGAPLSFLADLTIALGGVVPFSMRDGDVLMVGSGGPQLVGSSTGGAVPGLGMATQGAPPWVGALLSLCVVAAFIQAARLLQAHRRQRTIITDAVAAPAPLREMLRQEAARVRMRTVPELLLSSRTITPMVVGLLRPRIALPGPWTASHEATQHVLLHELAHVQRRDNLRQLITETARALYCWHPLVWWLARQARMQREVAADDAVLRSGVLPAAYARTLVDQTRTAQVRIPAAVHLSAGTLHHRVSRILGGGPSACTPWPGRIAALLILACTIPLGAVWPSGDHRRVREIAAEDATAPRVGPVRPPPIIPVPDSTPDPRN